MVDKKPPKLNSKCKLLFKNLRNIESISFLNISKFNGLYAILGGILGGLGFLYNSNDVILGSMLVSPLTSPLLRSITGIITQEPNYTINGLISVLFLSILIVVIGIIMGYFNEHFNFFESPTPEMKRRITIQHMIVAFIIALIAGITIGISAYKRHYIVLAGISLVVSILPPLVNAGLYYGDFLYNPGKVVFNDFLRSLLLSFTNIAGIMISAYVTLKLLC